MRIRMMTILTSSPHQGKLSSLPATFQALGVLLSYAVGLALDWHQLAWCSYRVIIISITFIVVFFICIVLVHHHSNNDQDMHGSSHFVDLRSVLFARVSLTSCQVRITTYYLLWPELFTLWCAFTDLQPTSIIFTIVDPNHYYAHDQGNSGHLMQCTYYSHNRQTNATIVTWQYVKYVGYGKGRPYQKLKIPALPRLIWPPPLNPGNGRFDDKGA